MTRHARLIILLVVASFAFAFAGCAPFFKALPKIVSAVSDATLIVEQIDRYVGVYFAARPDPRKEKEVVAAIARARGALIVAERASAGATDLDRDKVDDAFAKFGDAYKELKALVDALGTEPAPVGRELPPVPPKPDLPEPLALHLEEG